MSSTLWRKPPITHSTRNDNALCWKSAQNLGPPAPVLKPYWELSVCPSLWEPPIVNHKNSKLLVRRRNCGATSISVRMRYQRQALWNTPSCSRLQPSYHPTRKSAEIPTKVFSYPTRRNRAFTAFRINWRKFVIFIEWSSVWKYGCEVELHIIFARIKSWFCVLPTVLQSNVITCNTFVRTWRKCIVCVAETLKWHTALTCVSFVLEVVRTSPFSNLVSRGSIRAGAEVADSSM
jgi:hypothetical protein